MGDREPLGDAWLALKRYGDIGPGTASKLVAWRRRLLGEFTGVSSISASHGRMGSSRAFLVEQADFALSCALVGVCARDNSSIIASVSFS